MLFGGTSSVGGSAATSAAQQQSKLLGKDDFIMLLVAQLENQDPLEPMKGTEFTAQLAQFSSVEQLYNMNEKLEGIQQGNASLYASQAVNMIGKNVEALGNEIHLNQSGSSTITFHLPTAVEEVNITIYDSNGKLVTNIKESALSGGRHEVIWNGTSSNGTPMPEGTYTFEVTGLGSEGAEITGLPFTTGPVTGIVYEGGQVYATVGNSKIPLNQITEISQNI